MFEQQIKVVILLAITDVYEAADSPLGCFYQFIISNGKFHL